MKKLILSATILFLSYCPAFAQKQQVYHGTVKTVIDRIDYSPDTIACWFKEIIVTDITTVLKRVNSPDSVLTFTNVIEHWRKGFVIWQVYKKQNNSMFIVSGSGRGFTVDQAPYYTDPYQFSTGYAGIFLYEDRKTKVTNKIIFTVKR